MAVYYYNGAKILAPFTINSNEPMFDMTTVSLKTQRASQGHQRWELSFNVTNEKETHIDTFLASFTDLEDSNTMVMPQLPEALKRKTTTYTNAPLNLNGSSGSSTITLSSLLVNNILPKGTFVKFQNHDKIYILTADVNFNSGNTATANIYPALTKAVPSGQLMYWEDNAVFTYYRSIDNQTGITFSDGVLSNSGTISLIEAV